MPHFSGHLITLSMLGLKLIHVAVVTQNPRLNGENSSIEEGVIAESISSQVSITHTVSYPWKEDNMNDNLVLI